MHDLMPTIIDRLNAKRSGDGWTARCPAHNDRSPSLSVNTGDDGRVLLHCHAGCSIEAIAAAIDLTPANLFPKGNGSPILPPRPVTRRETSTTPPVTYTYHNADGSVNRIVHRKPGKQFVQQAPDGSWKTAHLPRILYRLPEIMNADADAFVYVVEGEKDADNLTAADLIATTTIGGAGKKISDGELRALHGRRVVILPDNDESGRKHAQAIAGALQGKAASVRIVSLPDLPPKGDVSDWLEAGNDPEDLRRLAEAAPEADIAGSDTDRNTAGEPETALMSVSDRKNCPAIAAYEPFPIDALPEPVRSFVSTGATAIGTDPAYLALPLLAGLAAAVGGSRRLEVKPGWCEPCIVWTAPIGDSGVAKSPAMRAVHRPLWEVQRENIARFEELSDQYAEETATYERKLTQYKGGKGGLTDQPTKPLAPILRHVLLEDTTIESVAPILRENPRGVLVARDELAGWLAFDRYSGTKGAVAPAWLSLWDAQGIKIDRKTGTPRTIYVSSGIVSVTGGIQPGILRRAIGEEHRENGLLARLLLAYPPRQVARWTDTSISPDEERALGNVYADLLALQMAGSDRDPYPQTLTLERAALDIFIEYHDTLAEELEEMSGDLAACWSKLRAYAPRLAMVLQLTENPHAEVIGVRAMAGGVTLARWFGREARRVYAMLTEGEANGERRRLVEIITRKGGSVTVRDWQRIRSHRTSEAARAELLGLEQAGYGSLAYSSQTGRGQPSEVFNLSAADGFGSDSNVAGESAGGFVSVSEVAGNRRGRA